MSPEFSRIVRIDTLGAAPRAIRIEAEEEERAALARRFGLLAVHRLAADAMLNFRDGAIRAEGKLAAAVTQACVVTAKPIKTEIDEPFLILFRPQPESGGEEEIELGEGDLDIVFHDGAEIDIGEAAAETLSLALDPYPRAPDAEEALKAAGVKSEAEAGPFAALAALREKLAE